MTPDEVQDVAEYLFEMAQNGKMRGIAFAVIGQDDLPVFGHANVSYDLLGATELCKAGMAAKLFRAAEDAKGFKPEQPEGDS